MESRDFLFNCQQFKGIQILKVEGTHTYKTLTYTHSNFIQCAAIGLAQITSYWNSNHCNATGYDDDNNSGNGLQIEKGERWASGR